MTNTPAAIIPVQEAFRLTRRSEAALSRELSAGSIRLFAAARREVCAGTFENCFDMTRRRMEETLMEERKQMLLTLMKDPTYVPMKLKELAMLEFRRSRKIWKRS